MKLENNQSYGVNAQFSGGRPIGQSSNGAINLTFAKRSFDFSSVANYTGSFTITDAYGQTSQYYLTGSNQSAVISGSSFIPVSSSVANTLVSIKNFLNASASAVVTTNTQAGNLQATSSLNGTAGNTVVFTWNQYSGSLVTGSLAQNLLDGQGPTDYPYTIPFLAGGLYVGIPGTLYATTADNSPLVFVSASGFIPGVFKSVSSNSTAGSIIALK
jgi:hypothetical protein